MKIHSISSAVKVLPTIALLSFGTVNSWSAVTHILNVEIIQVRQDDGSNGSPLFGSNGGSFIYESEVNEIWNQAGIQVVFTTSTWNNTEAQRLTNDERNAIYSNTSAFIGGDPLPTVSLNSLQFFFVLDHSGTGYDGTAGSGWVGNPLANPNFSARNAGNAQLFISGTFSSNGRGIMANEGFASPQLAGTLAHEIGHALGLRHVEDVNGGAGAGTTQDPDFIVGGSVPNLMWGAGSGPAYNGSLNNDPTLTVLQENYFLNQQQIDAAIYNGERLDPDGNGTFVLQAIPEPSGIALMMSAALTIMLRRRR